MLFPNGHSFAESIIREVKDSEKEDLLLRLWCQWQVEPFCAWFPVTGTKRPPFTEAFQALYFEEELTHETFRQILAAQNISSIFELRESGGLAEIEVGNLHPIYTGLEGLWFTSRLDWLLYASHESSITVGGKWLLPTVQAAWPNWRSRIWTTPFYA